MSEKSKYQETQERLRKQRQVVADEQEDGPDCWNPVMPFLENWEDFFRGSGGVVPSILLHVVATSVLAGLVVVFLEEVKPEYIYDFSFHSFMGVAVGFLLVFRATIAFGRYSEGATHTADLLEGLRGAAMILCCYLPETAQSEERLLRMIRLMKLTFHVTVGMVSADGDTALHSILHLCHPLDSNNLQDKYQGLSQFPALVVLSWLHSEFHDSAAEGMPTAGIKAFTSCYTKAFEAIHGMNQVHSSPLPFPFRQLCIWFTTGYCYTAPFPLTQSFVDSNSKGWGLMLRSLVGTATITLAFFGINATAVELEDPYGDDANDIPLDAMATNFCTELDFLVNQRQCKQMHGGQFSSTFLFAERVGAEQVAMRYEGRVRKELLAVSQLLQQQGREDVRLDELYQQADALKASVNHNRNHNELRNIMMRAKQLRCELDDEISGFKRTPGSQTISQLRTARTVKKKPPKKTTALASQATVEDVLNNSTTSKSKRSLKTAESEVQLEDQSWTARVSKMYDARQTQQPELQDQDEEGTTKRMEKLSSRDYLQHHKFNANSNY